ncbi:MAG: FliH/SctL family protein [Betaproteobacteria bacterium]
MSDARVSGKGEERTARVWQPADYLSSQTVSQAFQPSAWMAPQSAAFVVPSLSPPPMPEEEAWVDGPAQEPDPIEPEPLVLMQAAEPAVHSEQELERVRAQAYEEGRQQGLRETSEELGAQAQAWKDQSAARLAALEQGVRALIESPDLLYEPLKRLALHLAEQLVIGELAISPQAIERLIRRCVDELDAPRGTPVRIELHPDDLGPLQEWMASLSAEGEGVPQAKAPPWILQANATVLPGSVRASANDAMVTDLIEHRLEAMARQLLQVPASARTQSAFKPERLAARRAEVSQVLDAQPRMSESPRGGRFAPVIDADASPIAGASTGDTNPGATAEGADEGETP